MVPAQQRLGREEPAGSQVPLGLVVQGELATLESPAQVGLQPQPGGDRLPQLMAEQLDPVPTASLGLVEGGVRLAQQVGRRGRRPGGDRDAYGRADVYRL